MQHPLWRVWLAAIAVTFMASCTGAFSDPLPSWNEGPVKRDMLAFVAATTTRGNPEYVPPAERIAVFDNDGTLWAEQPMYFQVLFAIDRLREIAPQYPQWKTTPPFKAFLENDHKAIAAQGAAGLLPVLGVTHLNMTTDQYSDAVKHWAATATHPTTGKPYTQMVYQPMLELLNYLRANGYKTYIVSGGGVEFMRAFAEQVYGIPPEQVVGSSLATRYELRPDGIPVLNKTHHLEFVDDGPGKPSGINRFIGRRPVMAFGNSDGDREMLEYVANKAGPHFVALVHHTDATREWRYDRTSPVGKLDKALDQAERDGWPVIDMQRDWNRVFPQ